MELFDKGFSILFGVVLLAGCSDGGLSTAEASEAAKQQVRDNLGLSEDAALFSQVYVGEPVDGQEVLCGTVEGTRADGTKVAKRRFALTAEEPRWLIFETAQRQPLPSRPDKFIEWHTTCFNEAEV